jgi:hypothetical protein
MEGNTLVHIENMQTRGEQPFDKHGIKNNGPILPSSSAEVQAAIAAIQSRSAALRRQTAQNISSLHHHDDRSDGSQLRKLNDQRQELESNSSIDSDDSSQDGGQQAFFSDIEAVIDHVNGKKQAGGSQQNIQSSEREGELQVSGSSSSDLSSDDSLIAEGMVSNATQLNISAFIDSLNSSAKEGSPRPEESPSDSVSQSSQNLAAAEKDESGDLRIDNEKEPGKVNTPAEEKAEEVTYDEKLLNSHIDKAIELTESEWPEARTLEFIIFYARKDKVPIIPILDAFDDKMETRKDIPSKRLSRLVRQTVHLVETNNIVPQTYNKIISTAEAEKFEVSMFKAILRNPHKHVKYVERVIDTNSYSGEETLGDDQTMNNSAEEALGGDQKMKRKVSSDTFAKSSSILQSKTASKEEHLLQVIDSDDDTRVYTNAIYFEEKMDQLIRANQRASREEFSRRPHVDGVEATRVVLTKKIFKRLPTITPFRVESWKLRNEDRSQLHKGYKGVHSESIELAVQLDQKSTEEALDWENLEMELATTQSLMETADFFGT